MVDKKDDINSTEKLLNAIRGKSQEAIAAKENQSDSLPEYSPALKISQRLANFFPAKEKYSVGVDISHEFIYLAKTIYSSQASPRLIDQKIIKYDEKTDKESPEFNSLLKSSLLSICGNPDNCNIWTSISAGEVNMQHVKIPPVQKKQMENAIYWAAKKELSFDEKEYVFDYEIQEDIIDQGLPKHSVMVYSAPKAEIEKIKTLFSNIGISLSGITILPFAIQNIFRAKWLRSGEGTTATLFIGHEFSRINIYKKNNLVMTRGIKTGVNSMVDAITESFLEKKGASRLEKAEAEKILFSLGSIAESSSPTDVGFGIKEDELFKIIIPVVDRLTRQVERTIEHYTSAIGQDRVEKIYISSVMNVYDPISSYIGDQLGVKMEAFDPLKSQAASQITETISLADRMALVPAMGLSFSRNELTPNLIFTYKQKNAEINIRTMNRGIIAAFAAALIVSIATIVYQGVDAFALNKQKGNLKREISLFNPVITKDSVTKIADEVKMQRKISRQYAQRYTGMAVIGEITTLTPENIRLNNLKIVTSVNPAVKEKTDKAAKEDTTEGVTLEGIITGERNMLDSYLAQYIMKLGNSPMLHQVSVYKNSIVNFKKNDVLHFTMSAKIGKQ